MAIGMCHFRYLWNGMFARVEGQNITAELYGLPQSLSCKYKKDPDNLFESPD